MLRNTTTMVKSKKKVAKQPVTGTFGKIRKHVVARTVKKGSVLGYFLVAKRGAPAKSKSAVAAVAPAAAAVAAPVAMEEGPPPLEARGASA